MLSLTAVITMCLAEVPIAFADEISFGNGVVATFDSSTGTLTVTAEEQDSQIPDYDINRTFDNIEDVTTVKVEANITQIGSYAFYNCTNLEEIMVYNYTCDIHENALPDNTDIVIYSYSPSLLSTTSVETFAETYGYETDFLYAITFTRYTLTTTISYYPNGYSIEDIEFPDFTEGYTQPTAISSATGTYLHKSSAYYWSLRSGSDEDGIVTGNMTYRELSQSNSCTFTYEVIEPSTYDTEGTGRYTCTVCGFSYDVTIEAGCDHDGTTSLSDYQAPTCTEDGYSGDIVCDICNQIIEMGTTLSATGHTAGSAVTENTVEATCEEDGSYDTVIYCLNCGEELSRDTVTLEATGHSYGDYASNNDGTHTATCANDSSHTDTQNCLYVYSIITSPTYTESGLGRYTCSVCGYSYDVEIPATDCEHANTELVDYAEATCESIGYTGNTYCNDCGQIIATGSIVPALGHDYETATTDPTCTQRGYTTYTCTVCGNSYNSDYTDALGHTASEAVTENEVDATCTQSGSYDTVIYCSECGAELSRITTTTNPLGHTTTEEIENYVAPTCTEDGSYDIVEYCTVCGEQISSMTVESDSDESLLATGHTEVTDEAVSATCTSTGLTQGIHCSVCGEVITAQQTVPATGHYYVATVVAPTYTAQGYTQYVCEYCSDTYYSDYTAQLSAEETTVPATAAPTTEYSKQPTSSATSSSSLKKTSIKKLKKAKKSIKVTWKKVNGVTGYQIQYSTSKKFTKKTTKTVTVKGASKKSKTISKLKSSKKYYVRVRTYKKTKKNGKVTTTYSAWSKVKKVTTK